MVGQWREGHSPVGASVGREGRQLDLGAGEDSRPSVADHRSQQQQCQNHVSHPQDRAQGTGLIKKRKRVPAQIKRVLALYENSMPGPPHARLDSGHLALIPVEFVERQIRSSTTGRRRRGRFTWLLFRRRV